MKKIESIREDDQIRQLKDKIARLEQENQLDKEHY
jgi:hypothetical protein